MFKLIALFLAFLLVGCAQITSNYIKAHAVNKTTVAYIDHKGNLVYKAGGTHAWRNNNPGNLRSSSYQIGHANGYAVFATYEAGLNAMVKLLKEKYSHLSVYCAIYKYAPPVENNTKNYQNFVKKRAQLDPNKKVGHLTHIEFNRFIEAIKVMEGYKEGTTYYHRGIK